MKVRGALVSMGEKAIDRANWDWNFVGDAENPFFTPDPASVPVFADYLDGIRKAGSSVGAVIEIVAEGVPAGLGAPIYAKLDQDIAADLMSINAVKGVEIGNGFEAARITGEENADEMRMGNDGKPVFLSNNAGGILGGISTGQPVVARFAVKPTSSILTPRRSIDRDGNDVEVMTKGRHDPCVGIRAVPIGEAMVACAIADHYLRHRGQTGQGVGSRQQAVVISPLPYAPTALFRLPERSEHHALRPEESRRSHPRLRARRDRRRHGR